ncbi:hypothetical protein C9374_009075 [Naegleria lovaniensis]|uniref:Uncharacterized protein n=1 Tax=Naegleria lovaniensis TaxID=51637 RepID=A0AA88GDT0_NAELO|nr:uncharacterized protein C9374_009075 [Naegleria lovaniensis]KAG2377559.1 hypothetical protein C9374_009075 [Naegleria lovaniensis]
MSQDQTPAFILDSIKNKVIFFMEQQEEYKNAIFHADKLYHLTFQNKKDWSLNSEDPSIPLYEIYSTREIEAIYLLSKAYFKAGQFKRALHLLTSSFTNFSQRAPMECFFLAAKCLEKCDDWLEILSLFGDNDMEFEQVLHHREGAQQYIASLCFLRGKAFDMLDNKARAIHWYTQTLIYDPNFYEAFEKLVEKNLLNNQDQAALLNQINFSQEDQWIKYFYTSKIDRFCYINDNSKQALRKLSVEYNLSKNHDVRCSEAERYFYSQRFNQAYEITKQIIEEDPYNQACLPIHILTLVELNKKSELFSLSHKLVDDYKESAVSWFAVACYYYSIKKFASARSYFTKATNQNPHFLEAWLGIGHCFSNDNEPDQAMAAYRTAYRLFTGSHLPPLYIGMEHMKTNNLTLAQKFIQQALSICPTDPLVHNELGMISYKWKLYEDAKQHFENALRLNPKKDDTPNFSREISHSQYTSHFVDTENNIVVQMWEPIMFNLANTYRKLKQYDLALAYYKKCIGLQPKNASIYSAIGLTYHLQQYSGSSNLHTAIEYYHKALAIQPDHSFTATMLSKALVQIANQSLEYLMQQPEEEIQDNNNTVQENDLNVRINKLSSH